MTSTVEVFDIELAFFGRACLGEHYSGDLAFIHEQGPDTFLAIVDAAGHGRAAHMIMLDVENLMRTSETASDADLTNLVQNLHNKLKGGRGAVIIAGNLNHESLEFRYVRIGDSHGRVFGPAGRSLPGQAGMLGNVIPTPEVCSEILGVDDILVLCTDGISERFDLAKISGSQTRSSDDLAHQIIEQFGKDHDDATCIVVRCKTHVE